MTALPWVKPILVNPRRRSGYVTQAMIDRYGSFRAAVAALEKEKRDGR